MKRLTRAAVLVGVLAILFLGLRSTVFRSRPVLVEVATAERGVVSETVTNSRAGTVKARLRSQIGCERPGRVVAIARREGAVVSAGDLLVQLDTATAERQLRLALSEHDAMRARRESARAAAGLARLDRERTERLADSGEFVSQGQLDQVRARDEAARAEEGAALAGVERAAAGVRLAEEELRQMAVAAPFGGVVAQLFTEIGESVVPGRPLLELIAPDSLFVSAPIDEVDMERVRTGLPVKVTIDAFPGTAFEGSVTRVAPFVFDVLGQSRTMEIEVDFRVGSGRPRPLPGASADVEIILDTRGDVLRVPTFAVMERRRVLLARGRKAEVRDVTAGLHNWEYTEIVSGLSPGERVITSLDRPGVKAGARIRVEDAKGPPAP
jgi:HlyD family secretion protein